MPPLALLDQRRPLEERALGFVEVREVPVGVPRRQDRAEAVDNLTRFTQLTVGFFSGVLLNAQSATAFSAPPRRT